MNTFGMYLLIILAGGFKTSYADTDCYKHPPRVNLENCCQISNFITEEIKTKCMTEVFPNMPAQGDDIEFKHYFRPPGHHGGHPEHHGGPHNYRSSHHNCFVSCVLNETGIFTDNEFQDDNMIAYLNQIYDDSEIIDFISEQFRKCNEKREDISKKKPKNRFSHSHCPSNHGHMLIGCTYIHALKNCPNSAWSNTDKCNAVREHLRECGPPHHQINDEKEMEEDDIDDVIEEDEV